MLESRTDETESLLSAPFSDFGCTAATAPFSACACCWFSLSIVFDAVLAQDSPDVLSRESGGLGGLAGEGMFLLREDLLSNDGDAEYSSPSLVWAERRDCRWSMR